jgi:hypothetical protein
MNAYIFFRQGMELIYLPVEFTAEYHLNKTTAKQVEK